METVLMGLILLVASGLAYGGWRVMVWRERLLEQRRRRVEGS